MKEAKFHSNFHRITVCVNGVPLSMYADIEVTIKKPTKLDKASEVGWNQLKSSEDLTITSEHVPLEGR